MRIEDGVKYYEEGERIVSGLQWNSESEQSGAALVYPVGEDNGDMVCILAEVATQEDIRKIWNLIPKYKERKCEILRRTNSGSVLLL